MAAERIDVIGPASAAACCMPLSSPVLTDGDAATTAHLFKALAHPHRVRIVNVLATKGGSICGCDLEEPLGLSQPTVSFHLNKLYEAGLLDREKRGVWVYWSLNRGAARRVGNVLRLDPKEDR